MDKYTRNLLFLLPASLLGSPRTTPRRKIENVAKMREYFILERIRRNYTVRL
jgi:hypothetical protein